MSDGSEALAQEAPTEKVKLSTPRNRKRIQVEVPKHWVPSSPEKRNTKAVHRLNVDSPLKNWQVPTVHTNLFLLFLLDVNI